MSRGTGQRLKLFGVRRHDAALAALFENQSARFSNRALALHREAKAETCPRSPKYATGILRWLVFQFAL
jgi:hypothetical protein